MTEQSLSDKIWAVLEELLKLVAEYLDTNFESFIQILMQKGDPDSNSYELLALPMPVRLRRDMRNLSYYCVGLSLVVQAHTWQTLP